MLAVLGHQGVGDGEGVGGCGGGGGGEVTTSRLGPVQVVEESQACICKVVKTHPVFSKDCYRESVTGGRCLVVVID